MYDSNHNWLGMDTSSQLRCPYCPDHQLDPLGHHAVTCKGGGGGGDVVMSHNLLRDVFPNCVIGLSLVVNLRLATGLELIVQIACQQTSWCPTG